MSHPKLNQLLQQLPEADYVRLLPHLELCALTKGQVLVDVGQIPQYVYFPISALISVIAELDDGYKIETVQIGRQTMMGLSFGRDTSKDISIFRAKVCSSGIAYRLRVSTFIHFSDQSCDFQRILAQAYRVALRRVHFIMACSHHHSLEQQLIRWLLTCVYQTHVNKIEVTHAELSEMLGFSREVVTVTLGKLAHKGFIGLARGEIHVLNHSELERHACECYWLSQGQHRPLFSALTSYA